jgi:hypothetical protein
MNVQGELASVKCSLQAATASAPAASFWLIDNLTSLVPVSTWSSSTRTSGPKWPLLRAIRSTSEMKNINGAAGIGSFVLKKNAISFDATVFGGADMPHPVKDGLLSDAKRPFEPVPMTGLATYQGTVTREPTAHAP